MNEAPDRSKQQPGDGEPPPRKSLRERWPSWSFGWAPAVIAAVFAVAFMAAVVVRDTGELPPQVVSLGEHAPGTPVATALEDHASGKASPEGLRPLRSFHDRDGVPCREFEARTAGAPRDVGVACRRADGAWEVLLLVEAPEAGRSEGGFKPASSPASEALAGTLETLGIGPTLAPDAEAALIARNWRP
jgi:hypothetical protein